jgi:hypothetical protein
MQLVIWENTYVDAMCQTGFVQGMSSPCIFIHKEKDIATVVHGDDFTSLGVESSLHWLADQLKLTFSIKERGILGPEPRDTKAIRLLSRIIAWEPTGIRYEADQRHAEIVIKSLNLDNAKGVSTPGTKDRDKSEEDDELLNAETATLYRACVARCNFLSLDRPDIQFATKELSRTMSKPTLHDMANLKRLGRHLKQHPRAVF